MFAEKGRKAAASVGGAARLFAGLLLVPLILGAGCQAVPQLVVATPAIYMSYASGIRSDVVNFRQIGAEIDVDAPVDQVWQTLTNLSNIPVIFPWMVRLDLPSGSDRTLDLGDSMLYETVVAGKKIEGTAVVTSLEKDRQILLTLFSSNHGTLECTLSPTNGGTRLSALLTTEIHNLSMIRPEAEVKAQLRRALSDTLKAVKLRSEGKAVQSEDLAGVTVTHTIDNSEVPFDVVKGVCLIDAAPETVWKALTQTGLRPRVFGHPLETVPDKAMYRLDRVGNGVPYWEKVGPFEVKGTAVVTNVVVNQAMDLSLLADFKGGAEFRLIPEEGKTRFSSMYYLQFPATYRGKAVDRKLVVAQMQKGVDDILQAVQALSEGKPVPAGLTVPGWSIEK